jgi:hypothetical protein
MSASTDFIASLALAQTNLYRSGGSILIGVGAISGILSLLVFTQKALRKNSCSICFAAISVANILLIFISLLISVLQTGFNTALDEYNLVFCRVRFYLAFLLVCPGPYYLIIASIDRTLITSFDARVRKWSNRRTTFIFIAIVTMFWILFHIHAFIYTELIQLGPNYYICYFQPGTYTIFVSYYALVATVIPFIFMTVFGLLTVRNLQRLRRVRPAFVTSNNNTAVIAQPRIVNDRERQLILMCLIETITYVIFCFPEFGFLLYQQITQYQVKTNEQLAIEQFVQSIITFCVNIPFSISSYIYITVSKTFRAEVGKLFVRIRAFCFH